MRIDWAVACRYAESDGNMATIVGAGVDVLTVPELPIMVGVMIAVRLAAPAEEFDGGAKHEVTCRVLSPSGTPVVADDGTPAEDLKLGFGTLGGGVHQRVPGWLVNPLFAFQVTWLAQEAGSYAIQTRAGDDARLTPIHVLLADPTAAADD